ncbi:MAG TPA: hypothetical protein VJZ26_06675 [Blastocatellia bacterium]|nr:hypothetical protein [Blastocatellia bacterium]
MPAKGQSSKQQAGNKGAAKSKGRKKPKGNKVIIEEAPLIIKGGSQATTDELTIGWKMSSQHPLDFTYTPSSTDVRPNIYTLSESQQLSGFVVLNAKGETIFTFPSPTQSGDYTIQFLGAPPA